MERMDILPLSMVSVGKEVRVYSIESGRNLRSRLKDMGLNEGMIIKVLHSYGRGSVVVRVGNTRLVLGRGMANKILTQEFRK